MTTITLEQAVGFDIEMPMGMVHRIERDVCHHHPEEVHAALGTSSESELQVALDGLSYSDWFAADGSYLGRDCNGIGVR